MRTVTRVASPKEFIEDGDGSFRYRDTALGDADTQVVKNAFDKAWYWYARGAYEGTGEMVGERDGRWFYYDMGHCSCHGPVDGLYDLVAVNKGHASLAALTRYCSAELQRRLQPLLKKAGK